MHHFYLFCLSALLLLPLGVLLFALGWLIRGLRCSSETDALRYRAQRAEDELNRLGGGSSSAASAASASASGATSAAGTAGAAAASTKDAGSTASAASSSSDTSDDAKAAEIDSLQGEVKELRANLTNMGRRKDGEAAKELASLSSERNKLRSDLDKIKGEAKSPTGEIKELKDQRAELNAQIAAVESGKKTDIKARVSALNAESTSYQDQLDFVSSSREASEAYSSGKKEGDDLTEISGVAEVLNTKLHSYGIYTYQQIIDWNDSERKVFSELLGFGDRIKRDHWVQQATALHKAKSAK